MRYYLFDKITAFTPRESIRAIKNVSLSEDFMEHHFPGFPIMPAALILEAMSQVCGAFIELSLKPQAPKVIVSIVERLKFRRMVFPGDTLVIEGKALSIKGDAARIAASASVEKELVVSTELTYVLLREDNRTVERSREEILAIWTRELPRSG
jgi:3-hydroxyacyl-[acyl-carrier-protein] dehydratase